MVKELVGQGQHYRSFLQDNGIDVNNFDKLFFKQNGAVNGDNISEERVILDKLIDLPDFNDRSCLVTNVVNTDGSDLHLILVPRDCPRLRDSRYRSVSEMPKPDESYLVEVWNPNVLNQRCKVPVLHSNLDVAIRIAKRRFSDELRVPMNPLKVDPQLVTPEEWVEYCRHLILDKKQELPNFIKRFADLEECAQQVRRERIANLPPAIVR